MTRGQVALRLAGLVAVVVVVAVVALTIGLPSPAQVRARFSGVGWRAGLAFAGVYAVVSLSPLPKTVFTLAAGAIFGVAEGLLLVIAGATIGAVAAFYLGRVLGREAVLRLTGWRTDRFDEQLARRGFLAVLVARLVPVVPFTALNYVAGLTAVGLRDFVLGTVLGMVPATAAYVTIGARGDQPGSWPFLTALATLAVLTLAGFLFARRRRRASSAHTTSRGSRPES